MTIIEESKASQVEAIKTDASDERGVGSKGLRAGNLS